MYYALHYLQLLKSSETEILVALIELAPNLFGGERRNESH